MVAVYRGACTRFKKARYRQKNKMKSRAKTRTRRFIGLHSFRYFFGIHTFSQRAFYPFLPCQTRISVFYVHTSFVAALNRRGEFIGTVALDFVSIKVYIQDILIYLYRIDFKCQNKYKSWYVKMSIEVYD